MVITLAIQCNDKYKSHRSWPNLHCMLFKLCTALTWLARCSSSVPALIPCLSVKFQCLCITSFLVSVVSNQLPFFSNETQVQHAAADVSVVRHRAEFGAPWQAVRLLGLVGLLVIITWWPFIALGEELLQTDKLVSTLLQLLPDHSTSEKQRNFMTLWVSKSKEAPQLASPKTLHRFSPATFLRSIAAQSLHSPLASDCICPCHGTALHVGWNWHSSIITGSTPSVESFSKTWGNETEDFFCSTDPSELSVLPSASWD